MPSLAYIYSLANRQGQAVLRSQLLRQHALHPNLPPRAARGAGRRRADRIHLSTSLTTNQTVCTDLTCHLPNTSRAFSGCSPVHLQATGPYIQAAARIHPGARIVQTSSLAGLSTSPGNGVCLRVGKVATAHT
eukprot:scaffold50999_cov56-Phaeocystis_antarctica.AAC.6